MFEPAKALLWALAIIAVAIVGTLLGVSKPVLTVILLSLSAIAAARLGKAQIRCKERCA